MLDICQPLRDLGFEVIEIEPNEQITLPGSSVKVRITPTYGDDTLMVIEDGSEVCLNLNDALHSAPSHVQDVHCQRLIKQYRRIDYMFCGYGVASHFPNCYRIPGKDLESTAAQRQAYFNRQWVKLVDKLKPIYAFPFAADVVLLQEELQWVNQATHNTERPTDVFQARFPTSSVKVVDIAPGFQIENGRIVADVVRTPLSLETLKVEMAEAMQRANRSESQGGQWIQRVQDRMSARLNERRAYLAGFVGDYRLQIGTHNGDEACLVLVKQGSELRSRPCKISPTRMNAGDVG
ncbi:MAG: hypothetical protein RIS44_1873 [Pseudomonadota bacterium]